MAKYESMSLVTDRSIKSAWAKICGTKPLPFYVKDTSTGFVIRTTSRSSERDTLAGYFNNRVTLDDFREAINAAARELDADVRRAA